MRNSGLRALFLVLTGFLLISCTTRPSPAISQKPVSAEITDRAGATSAAKDPQNASPQDRWQDSLAAAKKEGVVVIYTNRGSEIRSALSEAFGKSYGKQYGIRLEFIAGVSAQLNEKIIREFQKNLPVADVHDTGSISIFNFLKPAGVLDQIEPELIFPELTDPREIKKVWFGEKLNFIDKEKTALAFLADVNAPINVNTNYVKVEEIRSYLDLLNPKWKGRIVMEDPTWTGSGQKWSAAIGSFIMGWDYLRDLARQEPVSSRDPSLMAQWLALGKYPLALNLKSDLLLQVKQAGAPVKAFTPKEGSYATAGGGIVVLLKGRQHPNAARVYLNWLLSKESQEIWTRIYKPTRRLDVFKEGWDPDLLIQPGISYIDGDGEEFVKAYPEQSRMLKEIFAGSLQ